MGKSSIIGYKYIIIHEDPAGDHHPRMMNHAASPRSRLRSLETILPVAAKAMRLDPIGRTRSDPWGSVQKVATDGTWVSQILQTFGICIVSSWNLKHVETSHHPESTLGIITSWNSLFIFVRCFVSHFISEGFLGSGSWIVLTVCWWWSWSVEMDDCMLLRSRIFIGCTTLRLSVETMKTGQSSPVGANDQWKSMKLQLNFQLGWDQASFFGRKISLRHRPCYPSQFLLTKRR